MTMASNLRIGNLLTGEQGLIYSVIAINEHAVKAKTNIDNATVESSIDAFAAIPLTEEWLLRFGFEDTNNGYRATGAEIVYAITHKEREIRLWMEWLDGWRFESWNKCVIQYAHQIQNLYHSLTGEELQIKEP